MIEIPLNKDNSHTYVVGVDYSSGYDKSAINVMCIRCHRTLDFKLIDYNVELSEAKNRKIVDEMVDEIEIKGCENCRLKFDKKIVRSY